MESMNFIGHSNLFNNLRLCSRNEGKIKSYESCRDIRAWSHDVRRRDRYLREWIKCDMPICVLSTSILARVMRTMTCRSRFKATPRCHPDCKSKIVLDSICNSCIAMKECLKNEEDFVKYFDDEEFETSQWPCERCLEALKSIKMFWKIILEKVFRVNIPKESLEHNECFRTDSVRSVAKVWQGEMMQQAMLVRNMSSYLIPGCIPGIGNSCFWKETKTMKKDDTPGKLKNCTFQGYDNNEFTKKICKADSRNKYTIKSYKSQSTSTDCLSNSKVSRSDKSCSAQCRKQSKHCSARVKTIGIGCDASSELNNEINAYKVSLEYLQDKCCCQKKQMEKLKRENSSLRIEINNVYKNSSWKSTFYTPQICVNNDDTVALPPKPFECCADENVDTNKVKETDSEMIITMKNCKNEAFKHISLLQVLHKTNDPIVRDTNTDSSCCHSKEDPIELLTKVQNAFGAIVKREMSIANDRKQGARKSEINATFHKVNTSKSAPSCSTIMSVSDSDSHCVRTKVAKS